MSNVIGDVRAFIARFFKNYQGDPFEASPSQQDIFEAIATRMYPRLHIMTTTQFGKSDIVSQATLMRVASFPEKWMIIGTNDDKAKIIMNYAIGHIFDNPYFLRKLEIGTEESLDRIRRERSKNRLTFKLPEGRIGELGILSAAAHRQKDFEKAAMGFGAQNVIVDDAALIDDRIYATIIRMLGGYKDNVLVKIGNPFRRNHFLKSFHNDKYYKIVVDWHKAVAEGRLSQEFVDEVRKEMSPEMFGILYDCNFPTADLIDEAGYMPLLTEEEITRAMTDESMYHYGRRKIGVDVAAGGRNYSVILLRSKDFAQILNKNRSNDTMAQAGYILEVARKVGMDENKNKAMIYPDATGLGKGLSDRLKEQVAEVSPVIGGEVASNPKRFFNKKAENYMRLRDWIQRGGKLEKNDDWMELASIKYKIHSDRTIKLMPKEEMLRQGISSPDVADALAATFNDADDNFLYNAPVSAEIKSADLDPFK